MEINVESSKLLQILKKNKAIHETEYEQLLSAFYNNVAYAALEISKQAESCDGNITLRITAIRPVSNSKDYADVIGMLELSADDTFKLNEKDYKKYVLDEWDWSASFIHAKSSYGMS